MVIKNEDELVSKEYMNDYIDDIEHRVLSGRLSPEDMRFVQKYNEIRKQKFTKINLNKFMEECL